MTTQEQQAIIQYVIVKLTSDIDAPLPARDVLNR